MESNDPAVFEGPPEQYVTSHGVPVITVAGDPPSVANNHVISVLGSSGPSVPANTSLGRFYKSVGATKVAGVAAGDISIAVSLMETPLKAAETVGVKTVLLDTSPTVTTTDFTPSALKIKASGAEGLYTAGTNPSNEALAEALDQQGVHLKGAVYSATLYEESVLSGPNEAGLEGSYVQNWFAPVEIDSAATKAYVKVLNKYAPGTFGGLIESLGYVSTELVIDAAAKVKGTPSAATIYSAIKTIKNFKGAGLIPRPLNYSISNTAPANLQNCFWYPEILNQTFVVADHHPTCGTFVKG